MTLTLKTLGAALITAGLMASAQAGPATINFDELRPTLSNAAGGVDVGDIVVSQYESFGVKFTGDNFVHCSKFGANPDCRPPLANLNVPPTLENFLANVQGSSISINVRAGFSLSNMSLSYAANASKFDIRLFGIDANGQEELRDTLLNSSSSTNLLWLPATLSGLSGDVRRIEFHAAEAASSFAIDNLRFDYETNSTNVPEPAALSLVALALAGVGLSRRRKA